MAAADKLILKFQSATVDPGNYQICDVDITTGTLGAQELAQIIAYFRKACGFVTVTDTSLVQILLRPHGSSGGTPLPFPQTEYDAMVVTAAAGGYTIPPMSTGYASNIGKSGSVLSPLGTSISVSERTDQPGPKGRGRHFLPYINTYVIAANGGVSATALSLVNDAYQVFILGMLSTTEPGAFQVDPVDAVVTSAAGTIGYVINSVKAQPVFSNLESRRR